jgi:hypothetical protein
MIPLFLAIDATTVLLAVDIHFLRDGDTLLPTLPEIGIMEGDTVLLCDPLAHLPDYIMFLIPAVEEGGGECVKTEFYRGSGNDLEPGCVAIETPLIGVGGNIGEKFLQPVFVSVDDLQFNQFRILTDRLQPAPVFLVGMYIVIVEKADNAHTGCAQFLHRIYGAWRAAYVEEYLHITGDFKSFSGEKQTVF